MDTEEKTCVEAPAEMGFDHRTAELLALDNPWLLMVEEETANLSTTAEGDLQKLDEQIPTMSGETDICSVAETEAFPVLIDFEKICLWDHDGDFKVGIRMEDPDYMKKMLMEWVHAVAAYVRLMDAYEEIPYGYITSKFGNVVEEINKCNPGIFQKSEEEEG